MSSPSDPLPLLLPSCTTRYQTTSKMWALFKRPSIPPPPPCPFCLHPEPATRPPPPSLSWLPHNLPASSLAPFNPVCVQQLRLWKMSISSSHSAGLISSSALCNTISFWKSGPYPPPPPNLVSTPSPTLSSYLCPCGPTLHSLCKKRSILHLQGPWPLCLVSCILQDPVPTSSLLGGLPRLHTELALCSLLLELLQKQC